MECGKLQRSLSFALISVCVVIVLVGCAAHHHSDRSDRSGGATRSPREVRTPRENTSDTQYATSTDRSSRRSVKGIVPLTREDGVYYVTVKINDVPMRFVFDTGASIISMSEVEALFLYKQGTLTNEDMLGTAYFSDANGDTNEGAIINLRKVEIGGLVKYNVHASIVPNQSAPLLLGQSLLQEFGTLTIDNQNNQLIIQ